MNLVLHPSSQDRIINSYLAQPKSRRRGSSIAAGSSSRQNQQSPATSHSTTAASQYSIRPGDPQVRLLIVHSLFRKYPYTIFQPSTMTTIIPPQTPQFNAQGYTFPQQPTSMQEPMSFQNSSPYGTPPDTTHPTWGYNAQPGQPLPYDRASSAGFSQGLPSIHSFERTSTVPTPSTTESWQNESDTNIAASAYRAWPADPVYPSMDAAAPSANASPAYNHTPLDSSIRSSQLARQGNSWSNSSIPAVVSDTPAQSRYGQDSFPVSAPPPQFDESVYASTPYAPNATHPSYYPNSNYSHSPPPPPPPAVNPPNPRQSFTRTLVGPLSANACRLNDEHRKPGIFFLFQDLSVRTEGSHIYQFYILFH
jgi:hypothetical protein